MNHTSTGTYRVRRLNSDDFDTLMQMEDQIFGNTGESVLGPYYVRLCCDFFAETCFIAYAGNKPAGYILCFLRNREAYCTTLAVQRDFQGTRIVVLLLRSLVLQLMDRCDSCWFTVKDDNDAARALHAVLGAQDVEVRKNFYGPGDERIVSRIERRDFERMRKKYERLGLVEAPSLERVERVS